MESVHRFTNFRPFTPTKYADNLELSVEEFNKQSKFIPQYEQQVRAYNNKCVSAFTINRLRLQEVGLSKFERLARIKANHKIRKMIQSSDKELNTLETQRIEKLLSDISEKHKVNLFTLKKLI